MSRWQRIGVVASVLWLIARRYTSSWLRTSTRIITTPGAGRRASHLKSGRWEKALTRTPKTSKRTRSAGAFPDANRYLT